MNFRDRFRRFMIGRYGPDETFFVLLWVSVPLSVLNIFLRSRILGLMLYALLAVAIFRLLSRNIAARSAENRKMQEWLFSLSRRRDAARQRRADKSHVYRKCPTCRAMLRLPRRKGRHTTVCPKCGREFKVNVYQ